jgi:hypothetical protein
MKVSGADRKDVVATADGRVETASFLNLYLPLARAERGQNAALLHRRRQATSPKTIKLVCRYAPIGFPDAAVGDFPILRSTSKRRLEIIPGILGSRTYVGPTSESLSAFLRTQPHGGHAICRAHLLGSL